MNTKDICQLVYDRYNVKGGEPIEFSIPFISEYKGKDYVAFFIFEIIENEDNFEVKNIVKKLYVDYFTGEINEQQINFNNSDLPIVVNYDEDESYFSNIETLQDDHYSHIDMYFNNISNYNEVAKKLIPRDLEALYNSLDAKFLD